MSYKVLALVSGGKDSCYSMIQCVAAGHTIVGLANLRPYDEEGKRHGFFFTFNTSYSI
jgi:diphthine-ammonia ligase